MEDAKQTSSEGVKDDVAKEISTAGAVSKTQVAGKDLHLNLEPPGLNLTTFKKLVQSM